MPKVNKKFSYLKCSQCRKDKQKCLPVSRVWPKKCDRCKKYCYACSPNTSTTQPTNTVSESASRDETPERVPHYAASGSDSSKGLVDVEFLSELTGEFSPEGTLHFAVKRRAIKLVGWLLAHGVDVESRVNGSTALYEAVGYEYNDVVELLLSKRADVSAVNYGGMNPLHLAASRDQVMTVKLLLQGSSGVEIPARECKASIAAYDSEEQTPLHHAVLSHNEDIIRLLLAAGADVNAGQEECDPPLYTAVNCESPLNIIQCLLDHEARVSAMSSYEETPLHRATTKEIIDLLLKYVNDRSTVDIRNLDGHTALHRALIHDLDDGIVASLVEAGACVSIKDRNKKTPLHEAAWKGSERSMRLLLNNVKQTSDLDVRDDNGLTALYYAFDNASAERILALLLEAGASVATKDYYSQTPLHLAAMEGSVASMGLLLNHVKQTSDLNIQDTDGSTALHLAIRGEFPTKVEMLLESGADFNVRSNDKSSALELALKSKEIEIRKLAEDFVAVNEWRAGTGALV